MSRTFLTRRYCITFRYTPKRVACTIIDAVHGTRATASARKPRLAFELARDALSLV